VFSQNIFLKGTVIDKSTGITIAMAHVRVGDIVTYTNAKGEFVLNIPSVLNENIEVFHMGYDTYFSEIQSEKPYLIALRPVEPTISSELTGVEIMTKVFSRLHLNYEIHDQFMLSYYRESLTDNDELHYIAEGIMELMIGSNMDDSPSLVRPIKTRVKTVNNIVHEGIDVKSGHATEMVESSIWHEKSFLREKNRWDYEYKLVGTEMHRNEHIFIIEFAPKNKDGYVAGRIYVDEYTYAIIRLEYTLFENLQFDTEVWIEEFQHHDLIYYLLRASFEGTWEENGEKYVFKSLIVNTEVESNRDASDLQDFYLGSSFTFPIQSRGEFTDEYWGDYNYIKLTEEEKAQLK
ncbi:unnamed protein product, partial [Chrysoparadoxa australica]